MKQSIKAILNTVLLVMLVLNPVIASTARAAGTATVQRAQSGLPARSAQAKAPTPTATLPHAGGDSPDDAPPAAGGIKSSAPRAAGRMGASAAGGTSGQTKVNYQYPDVTLTVSDGSSLNQYLYAGQGPITFDIDMQGLSPAADETAFLLLRVWDVDQGGDAGAPGCASEVDKVYVNEHYLGDLSGANEQWSVAPFALPAADLDPGLNHVRIDIDTLGTGCWAVELDSAQVQLRQDIAQTQAWVYGNETILQDATKLEKDSLIWESKFDANGKIGQPAPNASIPLAVKKDSAFYYRYVLNTPNNPNKTHTPTPTTQYTWTIYDASDTKIMQDSGKITGWGENDTTTRIPITAPGAIGKYKLTLKFDIYTTDGEYLMLSQPMETHPLYVLFDTPTDPGTNPRTVWLDRAMEWAGEKNTITDALVALNQNEYQHQVDGHKLEWIYTPEHHHTSVDQLISGAASGDCGDFTEVLVKLAASLGISFDGEKTYPTDWIQAQGLLQGFLTEEGRSALDNSNLNARPAGDPTPDRFFFSQHVVGHYIDPNDGTRWLFDPTFGSAAPSDDVTAAEKNIYCLVTGVTVGGARSNYICESRNGHTPAGKTYISKSIYEYTLPGMPTPAPGNAIGNGITLAGVPDDHGGDPDGNGLYEWLQVDLPVDAARAGDYYLSASLASADGHLIDIGSLGADVNAESFSAQVHLEAGAQSVPVYFNGQHIRAAGLAGPYSVSVALYETDPNNPGESLLSDSATLTTQAYTAAQFQGPLIENLALTDGGLNHDAIPGHDALRITAQFNMAAAGTVSGRATLFGGGKRLGLIDLPATSLAAGPQSLHFDFPGASLFAARVDGPYTMRLELQDQYYPAEEQSYTTAAYNHTQFQAPAAYFTGQTQDAGLDLNGDNSYDQLTVSAQLASRLAGDYSLTGTLRDGAGNAIQSVLAQAALNGDSNQPQSVALHFDGLAIARHAVDGPYRVVLELRDSDNTGLDSFSAATAAYAASAFQQPGAQLAGTLTDSGLDTDADGAYNALRVNVPVNVSQPGDYSLSAGLHDGQGQFIGVAQSTVTLAAGPQTMTLDFDAAPLRKHKVDGPYQVIGLDLSQGGANGLLDYRAEPYQTAAYPYSAFRPDGPLLTGQFSDQGLDTDGNGLYDKLLVKVQVSISQAATYTFNARLVDTNGDELAWASGEQAFGVGDQWVTLRFDGRYLSGHEVNGPYHLQAFSIYSYPQNLTEISPAYAGSAYDWHSFEPAYTVRGLVTDAAGQPLKNVHLHTTGADSDLTDAAGRYTLTALTPGIFNGTHYITIDSDPAQGPWQIFIDGQFFAIGTIATIHPVVGVPLEVDFVNAPNTPTPTRTPTPTMFPSGTGSGLTGEYFNNFDLSGAPLFARLDPQVDFDWGEDSPAPDVINPDFSARWSGQVQARSTEKYVFSVLADDGVRLWVNGQKLIDDWDAPTLNQHNSAPVALTAGQKYDLTVEIYDSGGLAQAHLYWRALSGVIPFGPVPMEQLYPPPGGLPATATPLPSLTPTPTIVVLPPGSGSGLTGEYFNNFDLSGAPVVSRLDPQVDFDWGEDSPAPGVVDGDFSARWSGQVQARSSEDYIFSVLADDGVRLWVNGQKLIDDWDNPSLNRHEAAPLALTAGEKYDVAIEFYDSGGLARAQFYWQGVSGDIPFEPVPVEQLYPPLVPTPTPTLTLTPTSTPTPAPFNPPPNPGGTSRISVASSGIQGNDYSYVNSISADGRYVVFASMADNLVSGDTNGNMDVFLRDRQTDSTTRISVDSSGTQGNNDSLAASISADGRYVAFVSYADNLVDGDTNGAADVFLRDTQTNATTRISVSSDGTQGNRDVGECSSISTDGRYVAFVSYADNLVSLDTNETEDVFLRDTQTNTTTLISVSSSGAQGNGPPEESVAVSGDGRYVAFVSYADTLVSGDTNSAADVFLRDTQTAATTRISVDSSGTQANSSSYSVSISADGRYVAFISAATNLVDEDTNGAMDVFLRDTQTDATTLISVDSSGTRANNDSYSVSISADGHYVVFSSSADNLVDGDTNGTQDVFLRDRQGNTTKRISISSSGAQGNNGSYLGYISSDGRYVAFSSAADNLVNEDTNGTMDVFLHENDYRPTVIPTMTATPTATPALTLIVDEFDHPLLSPEWEWYLPAPGPTYALDANPGHIQLNVPPGYDYWGNNDRSPQLRRSDMGGGDWAIQTHVALGENNVGDAWQTVLMADFNRFEQLGLGVSNNGDLYIVRPNISYDYVGNASLPLSLRIEKTGSHYTFKYKSDEAGSEWVSAGTYKDINPVAYVGLTERTFDGSAGDAKFDYDYFRLERYGDVPSAPYTETEADSFDGPGLNSGWEWYTPKSGPTYSLEDGSLKLSLPAGENYEHWMDSDNAPQLRRYDLGDADWAMQGELTSVNGGDGAGYIAGLEVGFDQYDQAWFGMGWSNVLNVTRPGMDLDIRQQTLPISLRIEKHGQIYTFKYRHDANEAWTIMAPHTYEGTPSYVGLITRVYSAGSEPLEINWSSFQLERYPSAPSTPTPTPAATLTPTETLTPSLTPMPTMTPTVTNSVQVTVEDTDGAPKAGLKVYAFNDSTYSGYSATTDANGQVTLTLPQGGYRFRADYNTTQFWSSTSNDCDIPGCTQAAVTVTNSVQVTVQDTDSAPKAGLKVYAFNGSTYSGYTATTDANGQVTLTLPQGGYRFRADYNGAQFWSGTSNGCDIPGCTQAAVTVTNSVQVTVQDTDGAPKAGLKIYAFSGSTYSGYSATTDANGQVTLTLPQSGYRFRADYNGTQFWSGTTNGCDIPGCTQAAVTVTNPVLVTIQDTNGVRKSGLNVYAFNGSTYSGYSATTNINGQVTLTLPQGSYRFRADYNGAQFWSGTTNGCDIPGCTQATVTVTSSVQVTVQDTDGTAKTGLKVYAFNGSTYSGCTATTDANGQVTLTLPQGSYRFRADLNGTQFWSGTTNHCSLPGCDNATVTVTIPVTLTIQNASGTPISGVKVYAFTGSTYSGYTATTNASGQVTLTLPQGSYRFRADYNSLQYWSGAANSCAIPGCASLTVVVGPAP